MFNLGLGSFAFAGSRSSSSVADREPGIRSVGKHLLGIEFGSCLTNRLKDGLPGSLEILPLFELELSLELLPLDIGD